jgi:hypothetical protein
VFGLRPLHGFVSATFGAGVNALHCPITCPKRQLPRTLCEMVAKAIENILIKMVKKAWN